jgi:hypothetical protein
MQVGVDRCFASREEPPGNVNNGDVHSKGRRYAWKGTNRIMNNGWADNIWIPKNTAGGGGENNENVTQKNKTGLPRPHVKNIGTTSLPETGNKFI